MFDDIRTLFHHNVVNAFQAYLDVREGGKTGQSQHLRSAMSAATQLFHFREHLPKEHARSRSQVVAACADYRLIADVANVAKHRKLERQTSEGPPLVDAAEHITEITIVVRYEDEEGAYSDTTTRVVVDCSDGIQQSLDSALTNVMNYWGGELHRLGVLSGYKPFPLPDDPGTKFVPRVKARNMDLEILNSVAFKKKLRLLEFDAKTGCSHPIDLTGASLEMRIYKPAFVMGITVRKANGEEFSVEVPLSEEDSLRYATLKSEAERRSFGTEIAKKYREDIQSQLKSKMTSISGAHTDGASE